MERVAVGDRACDVLVVGGGGAGLRAALAAVAVPGTRVLLATKGQLGLSGVTALACSDRMAFHATLPHTDPVGPDAWRHHADDVYRIGGEVSDWDLAETLARESGAAFDYLDGLGVPFVKRPDGLADQFLTDGSDYARACYTGPHTANHIHRALLRRLEREPVAVLEGCLVAELAVDSDGRVAGAVAVDETSGRAFRIAAGAVVLATGGAGEVYATHVFPRGMTGDGLALALRAGCDLANVEFVQLGLCSTKTGLACSGSLMRALPRVVDDAGDEFLLERFASASDAYDTLFRKGASWPVSSEHASRTIDVAVSAVRARGRRVFLDYAANPRGLELGALDADMLSRFANVAAFYGRPAAATSPLARLRAINPASIDWLRERGVDLERGDAIEIAPSAQHFQGGVRIRGNASTQRPGLYAAGECAGGQHGANRPGGHALLDGQVFGRIAGEAAADWATRQKPVDVAGTALDEAAARVEGWLKVREGRPAGDARRDIQATVDRAAGVVRTADNLDLAAAELRRLAGSGIAPDDSGSAALVETCNLLLVASALVTAAGARRESRGPHLRFESTDVEPLPNDDRYRKMSLVRLGERGVEVQFVEPRRPGCEATALGGIAQDSREGAS